RCGRYQLRLRQPAPLGRTGRIAYYRLDDRDAGGERAANHQSEDHGRRQGARHALWTCGSDGDLQRHRRARAGEGYAMKIGVFDSGVGGLTVLKELVKQAPQADYLYFGDTARLPYGSKSAETVAKYTISASKFLRQHGAEMMVIACNTATAQAHPQITQAMDVPVIGAVEPG